MIVSLVFMHVLLSKLAVVQLSVKAVSGKKLLMISLLNDVSVLHHEDQIRFADGG